MKNKKVLSAALALAMTATTLAGMTVSADVPAFEDLTFPDAMPESPTQAEEGYYDYDDMSVHYDLKFVTYSYGVSLLEDDPIKAWMEEKYNVTITLETVQSSDLETNISTSFAGGDTADVYALDSGYKNLLFTLGEQGLLVDGKEILPYMPQICKFNTNTLIQYSTMSDGTMPFVTKYAVQDGDIWNLAIHQDWLDALGLEAPTTEEELIEVAKAFTFNDPDGNGENDTYFMLGAGSGSSFGMLEGFATAYGNPNYSVGEDGKLVVPMMDGTRQGYLQLLNKFYTEGVMPTDWFTIEWENAKAYTLNDKIGMVRYPASNLYTEYLNFNGDASKLTNWSFLETYPIEGGKAGAGGNAGVLFAIPTANIGEDTGKLMRICHILDAMVYGGEAYFATVQNGDNFIWGDYDGGVREYLDNGRNYCYVPQDGTENEHPIWDLDSTGLALAPWQNFGYTLKWQDEYAASESEQAKADAINGANATLAGMDRWENTALMYTLPGDVTSTLNEWVLAEEYKFVTGERSFDEWDTYVEEWLAQGGVECIKAAAEGLGCELPDGIE